MWLPLSHGALVVDICKRLEGPVRPRYEAPAHDPVRATLFRQLPCGLKGFRVSVFMVDFLTSFDLGKRIGRFVKTQVGRGRGKRKREG